MATPKKATGKATGKLTKPKAKATAKAPVKAKATPKRVSEKVNKAPAFGGLFGMRGPSKPATKPKKDGSYIKKVSALADKIHEESATGKTRTVKVYGITRSEAKAKAFKQLAKKKATGKTTKPKAKAAAKPATKKGKATPAATRPKKGKAAGCCRGHAN